MKIDSSQNFYDLSYIEGLKINCWFIKQIKYKLILKIHFVKVISKVGWI